MSKGLPSPVLLVFIGAVTKCREGGRFLAYRSQSQVLHGRESKAAEA